ncbi:MAG: aldehyde dehydrogenase (NADP(+)) [Cytophagales bacterium]|nr:aldehyde dehydrogenase (NADP(+)) [Bernardetiaceae bacterium]MDW8210743.1 aldehyde dehydrogenase (NADP(+)) [Cytophagales bacterium]
MLQGAQFLGFGRSGQSNDTFSSFNPRTGQPTGYVFYRATIGECLCALELARSAFEQMWHVGSLERAAFLRAVADGLEKAKNALLQAIIMETALPPLRIQTELVRTQFQLTSFADLLEKDHWQELRYDPAQPERKPTPKPALYKMLVPVGPVVVFGAANFPLAYSVAGVDTAAAWAAGCPVIVKAHPAHPRVSEITAEVITQAALQTHMPEGIFSMLFDDGTQIAQFLVQHPYIKAGGFTGSLAGGMALYRLAQQRPDPIPFFAEMSSLNPVILLPKALQNRAETIAQQLTHSICNNMGQFCTKPGLLLAIDDNATAQFLEYLKGYISQVAAETMLNEGIYRNYLHCRNRAMEQQGVEILTVSDRKAHLEDQHTAIPTLLKITSEQFLKNPVFAHEIFGPCSIVVLCPKEAIIWQCLEELGGQLTCSIFGEPEELINCRDKIFTMMEKAGRLIFNGVPTGVEVSPAMQHGGPFPATTDSRFGSVGADAIRRFLRPVAFQNCPTDLLPLSLQNQAITTNQ